MERRWSQEQEEQLEAMTMFWDEMAALFEALMKEEKRPGEAYLRGTIELGTGGSRPCS
jgi:hypothetical protein